MTEPFSVSNEELEKAPRLPGMIDCPHCGKRHRVRTTEPLQWYRCRGDTYLAGVRGKSVMGRIRQ